MTEQPLSDQQNELIAKLFADLAPDFDTRLAQVSDIRESVHRHLAKALEDSLNKHLSEQRQATPDERRKLAADLNACLRGLGLGIKCPRTNLPAILIVDNPAANQPDRTRFRLEVKTGGGRYQRTLTDDDLPLPLELIPALPRREGLARNDGIGSDGANDASRLRHP